MKTKTQLFFKRLLPLALLAGLASAASAATVNVNTPVSWDSITSGTGPGGKPGPADDIFVFGNTGKLKLDSAAAMECKNLTIGDAATFGVVEFPAAGGKTLTINGNLAWGGAVAGNLFTDPAPSATFDTLVIAATGTMFTTGGGSGTFDAGTGGLVQFTATGAQTVPGLLFCNLDLGGTGVKTLNSGVIVGQRLRLVGTCTLAGTAVTYGSNGYLFYGNSTARTTSPIEFPATMDAPVTINNALVTLDGNKTLNNLLTINATKTLNDGGFVLTVTKNVNNSGTHAGTGKMLFVGNVDQNITGTAGHFGNVEINKPAANKVSPPAAGIFVDGRLTMTSGKLNLSGVASTAQWLTLAGVHQPAGTYGEISVAGTPAFANPTYFLAATAGAYINVSSDLNAQFVNLTLAPTITFGDSSIVLSGQLKGDASPFGTIYPADGQNVVITLYAAGFPGVPVRSKTTTTTGGNGSFSTPFDTTLLSAAGSPYTIEYKFNGDSRLGPATDATTQLVVYKKVVEIWAESYVKTYGDLDPVFQYQASSDNGATWHPYPGDGALTPPNAFINKLGRDSGENIGAYAIKIGALSAGPNYQLHMARPATLTIVKRAVNVYVDNKDKVYNGPAGVDPALTFRASHPPADSVPSPYAGVLADGDHFDTIPVAGGALLERDPGTIVGTYEIRPVTGFAIRNATGTDVTANYSVTFGPNATFTITACPVTVIPINGQTKVFGQNDAGTFSPTAYTLSNPNPVTYLEWPGLPLGVGQLKRDGSGTLAGENAGAYEIREDPANPFVFANYTFTVETGHKFTITPAPVAVRRIDDIVNKTYGDTVAMADLIKYVGLVTPPGASGLDMPDDPADITPWPLGTLPGDYAFSIVPGSAADPNYTFTYPAAAQSGILRIAKKFLTVTAKNQTKVQDGTPFPFTPVSWAFFDVTGFVGTDTLAADVAGIPQITGGAVTATLAGVYYNQIIPNTTLVTSDKYRFGGANNVPGTLTITKAIGTTTGSATTWAGGESYMFEINKADAELDELPGGIPDPASAAGKDPGWSLLKVPSLTISATTGNKFQINLVTLVPMAYQTLAPNPGKAGLMAKFDPTRPWSWKFVQTTGGISVSDPAGLNQVIQINWEQPNHDTIGLFQNPIFEGEFKVRQDGLDLYIDFIPKALYTAGPPPDYAPTFDIGPLLASVSRTDGIPSFTHPADSDIATLYLELQPNPAPPGTNPYEFNPGQPVVVKLKVKNLKQNQPTELVDGVQAFINFSSQVFWSGLTDASFEGMKKPEITAGSAEWNQPMVRTWTTGGDMDIVMGITLGLPGTLEDGDIANIKLYCRRTSLDATRVVFRPDAGLDITKFNDVQGRSILPARVPTRMINIQSDTSAPVVVVTATQDRPQPWYATGVDVADYTHNNTVRGTVRIVVEAGDAVTGLSAIPTLTLQDPVSLAITTLLPAAPVAAVPPPGVTRSWVYLWNVDASTANGDWQGVASATDNLGGPGHTTETAFTLRVNINEITGVVSLKPFQGTERVVNFQAGEAGNKVSPNLNLKFGQTVFLPGSIVDRWDLAQYLNTRANPVASFLMDGDIVNLPAFVARLNDTSSAFSVWLRQLILGDIITDGSGPGHNARLQAIAQVLVNKPRPVDAWVASQLSTSTATKLADYWADWTSGGYPVDSTLENSLKEALLADFARIINIGYDIYDPVRFSGVALPTAGPLLFPVPTAPRAIAELNRLLLSDAYWGYWTYYVGGKLNPQTSGALVNYTGGANLVLKNYLIADLNTLANAGDDANPAIVDDLFDPFNFYGITFRSFTMGIGDLRLKNRYLLEDAFASGGALNFIAGPIRPVTVDAMADYLLDSGNATKIATFETLLLVDLNALIQGSIINNFTPLLIFTTERFGALAAIVPPQLKAQLPPNPVPTGPALIKLNRQLLEFAFTAPSGAQLLNGSDLATFKVVDVPTVVGPDTSISAKTAWNLRETLVATPVAGDAHAWTAFFIGDGTRTLPLDMNGNEPFHPATDHYLRGGDIDSTQDLVIDRINLRDYSKLVDQYGTTGTGADVNGDGLVTDLDFNPIRNFYNGTGDPGL